MDRRRVAQASLLANPVGAVSDRDFRPSFAVSRLSPPAARLQPSVGALSRARRRSVVVWRPLPQRHAAAALVLLCLLASGASAAPPTAPADICIEANQLYEGGRFADAAAAYERALATGADGADTLYNLGTAYARQRQFGRALAALTAAQRIAPRDEDIRLNIQQVSAQRAEAAPQIPKSWLATVLGSLVSHYTLNEFVATTMLLLMSCTGLGVCVLLRLGPQRRLLALLGLAGVVLLCSVAMSVARYRSDFQFAPAFVCVESATMRSGPGEHFEDTGSLTDGASVQVLSESGGWKEIALPTGKRAWLRVAEIARM